MLKEKVIREKIKKTTEDNEHILNGSLASTVINAPRALMQIAAKVRLEALYEVLGEKRPKFDCDGYTKMNR